MFNTMMDGIKEESVGSLFNLQVQVQQDPILAEGADGDDGEAAGSAAVSAPGSGVPPAQPQSAPSQARPGSPGSSESARRQQARGGSGFGPTRRDRDAAASGQAAVAPPVPAGLAAPGLARPKRSGQLNYTAPSADGSAAAEQRTTSADGVDYSKVGRNAPCPCGSGRKFKQCHGDPRNR